jgi:hypothetical protein
MFLMFLYSKGADPLERFHIGNHSIITVDNPSIDFSVFRARNPIKISSDSSNAYLPHKVSNEHSLKASKDY